MSENLIDLDFLCNTSFWIHF